MGLGLSARLSTQWGLNQELYDSECDILTHYATLPYSSTLLDLVNTNRNNNHVIFWSLDHFHVGFGATSF